MTDFALLWVLWGNAAGNYIVLTPKRRSVVDSRASCSVGTQVWIPFKKTRVIFLSSRKL